MLHIDGRSVESEANVKAFNVPTATRIHIGVPNPVLASSGVVRGSILLWDLGPMLLVSSVPSYVTPQQCILPVLTFLVCSDAILGLRDHHRLWLRLPLLSCWLTMVTRGVLLVLLDVKMRPVWRLLVTPCASVDLEEVPVMVPSQTLSPL